MRAPVALALCFLSLLVSAQRADPVVAEGRSVTLEYTVRLDDGTVVDSSADAGPLEFVLGDGEMLPALETALIGMAVHERKTIRLEAADAYGPVDPNGFREVPIENLPESARRVGAQLRTRGSDTVMRVHEVRESTIVLDSNNPLAGKPLTFEVEILAVRRPPRRRD